MTPEALAEALYVTAVPSRTEQTADEIGPGRTPEERRRARMARFTEWAEVILEHPAVAHLVGNWQAGYQSGLGEGRKASSTAQMLGVFRVFDPRPLAAALADFDALQLGVGAEHDENVALGEAVRQALADAQVPTVKPEPVELSFDVLVFDGSVVLAGVPLEEALLRCMIATVADPAALVQPPSLRVRVSP